MVLRAVGEVLHKHCDGDEVACRMGREEFMLLLPECSAADAVQHGEAVRRAVENVSVRYCAKTLPRITILVGVAASPDHGSMPQDVMRVADDALYDAMALGRNQVVLASGHADTKMRRDGLAAEDQSILALATASVQAEFGADRTAEGPDNQAMQDPPLPLPRL